MKTLTINQLKKWKPCSGWTDDFQTTFGKSAKMTAVEAELIKRESWSALNWLIGKRLEKLKKRQVCAFAYLVSHRALKYAQAEHRATLETAIGFAREYSLKGKVDREAALSAAWSAARSAESAAWSAALSAESAAWSAESAAWSAESAARSAESAAWSAALSAESAARSAEYVWQLEQLAKIELRVPKNL